MDIALKLHALCPGAQYAGSLTANTESAYNALRWEDPRTKPTWAQLTAETTTDQAAAIAAGLAGIYAPVPYLGKFYPADTESMSKYEITKQSRLRGKLKKSIAVATDKTILKLTGTAAIDAFHAAMEDAITARVEAMHDAI